MGAFGTGFMGAIGDAVHQKATLARANEQKRKDMEAQYHWEALKARLAQGGSVDPNTKEFVPFTDKQRDDLLTEATGNMAKAYGGSKPVKEIMQHAQQLIGKATGHPLWGHPGSENMKKEEAAATPAATPAAATPQTAGGAFPAPPGMQAQAAAAAAVPAGLDSASGSDSPVFANKLDSASASDAAPAVSSPTSALASASPEPGKSAPSLDITPSSGGPSDTNQQLAPQTSSNSTVVSRETTLPPPPSSKAATAGAAPQGLPPAAPTPSAAAVPPPPGAPAAAMTGHQLMNSFISPYDTARLEAESKNAIDLKNKQAQFVQQQAQLKQHLANLAEAKGSPLTPTETMLAAGVKLPAAMFTPHYDPKVVLGGQVLANSQTSDGSPFNPAQTYHQVGLNGSGGGVYQPVSMPYQKAVIGNLYHAIDPYTHRDLGAISQEPVKLGTSSESIPSVRYLDAAGNWQVSQGSRSTNPQTGNAPLAPSVNAPIPPPPTPLDPSAPATVAAAAAAAQPPPKSAKGRPASAAAPGTAANRGGRMPGGITLPPGAVPAQQLAQQQNRNTAINVAGQGLTQFVTPQDDGMSNLEIFKDPAAVDRIANYMSLADAKLEGEWNEAEKGGVEGIAKFYAGLPQAYTAIQVGAIKDAYDKLTTRDKRFVADFTSLMGQWGGARKGTGASASLYNFKNMSKEMPNPLYIKSYEDAVNRARNMFNELNQMGQHNGAANTYDKDKILPKASKNGTTISPPPGNGLISVPAPDGSTYHFKTQKEADDFKDLLKKQGVQ